MNNLLAKKTRKLFYNEYPYKIIARVPNASFLRVWSIPDIINWCISGTGVNPSRPTYSLSSMFHHRPRVPTQQDRDKLLQFCTILSNFSNKTIKFRTERSTIGIFLKDKVSYGSVALELEDFITELWEPENDDVLSLLLNKKKTIICNEYPHGIYKYKVTLKPFKGSNGISMLNWIDKYSAEKLLISDASRKYIEENHPYYDPWLYVSDEKMVMMINFACSGNVRRCEEFVLRSSINTSS